MVWSLYHILHDRAHELSPDPVHELRPLSRILHALRMSCLPTLCMS